MISLQKPYISVARDGGASYGGSQLLSDSACVKKCGCGLIAAADLILYLGGRGAALTLREYNAFLERISPRYFPLVYPFGINGLMLAAGLDRFFLRNGLPYRAIWAISGSKLWERAEEMLRQDIPVILAVGPNFPAVWGKNRLPFYRKLPGESYAKACSAKAHYVTATAIDEKRLRISSWGNEYYIDRAEYSAYIAEHSSSLLSNIVLIEKREGKK